MRALYVCVSMCVPGVGICVYVCVYVCVVCMYVCVRAVCVCVVCVYVRVVRVCVRVCIYALPQTCNMLQQSEGKKRHWSSGSASGCRQLSLDYNESARQ